MQAEDQEHPDVDVEKLLEMKHVEEVDHPFRGQNQEDYTTDWDEPPEERDDYGQHAARPDIMAEYHCEADPQPNHANDQQQRTVMNEGS